MQITATQTLVVTRGLVQCVSKLSNLLKINIQGIGCCAHVVQNGVQMSAEILPIDIGTAVN